MACKHLIFVLRPLGPVLRSAVLEDCALCQETISSSELAAKARDGQFEGQKNSCSQFSCVNRFLFDPFSCSRQADGDRPTLC